MSVIVEALDLGIVGIFVGDEESPTNWASVRIRSIREEDPGVVLVVIDINGPVKGHDDHLWGLE
jgi:hypothetical protein